MQNDSEKRQTSRGYIIHILQWNFGVLITNFMMLFQAVMKFGTFGWEAKITVK
jgi:hypothetical protein